MNKTDAGMRLLRYILILCALLSLSGKIPSNAQNAKTVKSITLDQLLGKKNTNKSQDKVRQITAGSRSSHERFGAIGSVLERTELKGTALSQDQIRTPYRRYVVNGALDLGGKVINMPYGSILDLENGSLKNGTVKMNATLVTPVYGISKERNISRVKVEGEYYETLVDLWGERTEPLFPWDTTAPKKVYIVDLKKFGITPGYQKRGSDGHYSDRQYDLMYNNGVGFTNAIRWAYDNGYDGIRFPKNDYCFTPRTVGKDKPSSLCGQVLVYDLYKFDIDLGGGTYYNILDSSRKSKYYTLTPDKSYAQSSKMFFLFCCVNVQIHNGVLVGDRELRDYSDSKESSQEGTAGFVLSGYVYNTRLYDLDISCFMGDGISMSQYGNIFSSYESKYGNPGTKFVPNSYPGRYYMSKTGGIQIDSKNVDNCTVTGYIDLSKRYSSNYKIVQLLKEKKTFTVNNNLGYTRIPNAFSNVEVLTFNASYSKEIPLRIIPASYLESFSLNPGETGVKLQFSYDEGVGSDGYKHTAAVSDVISENVVIERCKIHDNHRGGISGGSKNDIIRFCEFEKNNTKVNYKGKKIPVFSVGGTNYHIDYEDSFAKGLEIYGCTFKSSNQNIGKLLFGVFTLDFHDNVSDTGIGIYRNIFSHIHDNIFKNNGLWLSSWSLSKMDGKEGLGVKYLTRVIYYHDNEVASPSKVSEHNRTIIIE